MQCVTRPPRLFFLFASLIDSYILQFVSTVERMVAEGLNVCT